MRRARFESMSASGHRCSRRCWFQRHSHSGVDAQHGMSAESIVVGEAYPGENNTEPQGCCTVHIEVLVLDHTVFQDRRDDKAAGDLVDEVA